MKSIDTLATGAVSLAAVEIAPQIAEVTANAMSLPITDILQIFIQVVTGVATLYKLFIHKKPKKEDETNV